MQDRIRSDIQDTLTSENEVVPLDALYEPSPVAFTFETPGWYVTGALLLIVLFILLFLILRKYHRNRYRRTALATLEELAGREASVMNVFILLKNVAIHAFGREKVGNLYGREWLQFLETTGKNVRMLQFQAQIEHVIYKNGKPSAEMRSEFIRHAKKWVKTHEYTGQL